MNPFDDHEATFVVLVNAEGQFSLWPEFMNAPAGWEISKQAATRAECLAYVDRNWTDLRPASLK
ncbi:MAG TPA: MbtH family NRPS accessory protein [Pseudonocardiaceae bacterium]|nr:MbtH family NRPS accessory protein [Pseudonocardiaceae bacterium]